MKKNIILSVLGMAAMGLISVSAYADDSAPAEKEVTININDAFIPGGFDAQSDVYVVVNGLFPNGCYRWNRAEVTVGDKPNVREVKSVATVSQGMCLMVIVPFTKEVDLGVLGAGTHKIRFMNGDGTFIEKSLTIEP